MKFLLALPGFIVVFAVAGWMVGLIAAEAFFPLGSIPEYQRAEVVDIYVGRGIVVGVLLGFVAAVAFVAVLSQREASADRLERAERRLERGYGEPNFDDFDDSLEVFEVVSPTSPPPDEVIVPPHPSRPSSETDDQR